MRTVFFGTPEIAAVALEALAEVSEVAAVVCQPDRPAGRGLKLKAPAAKVMAQRLGLEVVQPTKIRTKEFAAWLQALEADVALVIAYGRILPLRVLNAPRRGCLNLHASLLPHYRGAAPINWAIVKGETETGISLMQMDKGCDTGPVFLQRSIEIGPDETAGALYDRLATLAATIVREDLGGVVDGALTAIAQDHAGASHAPMLSKASGRIDWTRPATDIHNLVRGMTPWPGAHTLLAGKRFRVLETAVHPEAHQKAPGSISGFDEQGAQVACGEGTLTIVKAQLEGKKATSALSLAHGRKLSEGLVLGA